MLTGAVMWLNQTVGPTWALIACEAFAASCGLVAAGIALKLVGKWW